MKNILVLTDFTENATHAADWGLILSRQLHANIILYHTFLHAIVVPNYSGGPLATDELIELEDESKNSLQELAIHLDSLRQKLSPPLYEPSIKCVLGEGSLGNNVEEIIKKENIDLIVMGAPTESTLERILLGSSIGAVIEQSSCPIFVVPENTHFKKLQHIIFATDFDKTDIEAIRYLVNLGKIFQYHLEIIHVNLPGMKETHTREEEMSFIEQVAGLKYPRIAYSDIRSTDVVHGLNRIAKETKSDILALVHHQHSFFGRLFRTSTTREALSDQKIPLLVFPSRFG